MKIGVILIIMLALSKYLIITLNITTLVELDNIEQTLLSINKTFPLISLITTNLI